MIEYIINTITSWKEIPRVRHQLTLALSKKNKVFFITRNEIGKPHIKYSKINNNLVIVTPYFFIDYRFRYRMPIINEIYQKWLFNKLINSCSANSRVINFDHTATQIFKYFKRVVYYCNDEYIVLHLAKSFLVLIYHLITEKYVIKNSHFCVGVSLYLTKKMQLYNANSFYIPSGSYIINFKEIEKHENIPNIHKQNRSEKYFIYVGTIHKRRVQFKWLEYLASYFPEKKIILVGPVKGKGIRKLKKHKNIRFLGIRKDLDLYNIVASASVCIMPHFTNRSAKVAYAPNKLWLYLSFGRPVVSNIFPNLKINNKFVYQSENINEFINNILLALEQDNKYLVNQRILYAQQNSWNSRIEDLINIYEEVEK